MLTQAVSKSVQKTDGSELMVCFMTEQYLMRDYCTLGHGGHMLLSLEASLENAHHTVLPYVL